VNSNAVARDNPDGLAIAPLKAVPRMTVTAERQSTILCYSIHYVF
jgi:hypothetical protein